MTESSIFPVIENLDQFREQVGPRKVFRFYERPGDIIMGSYGIMDDGLGFENMWQRECRGILFRASTGELISRPLHKFDNVPCPISELVEWMLPNAGEIDYFTKKFDGSMFHAYRNVSGGISFASQRSLDTAETRRVESYCIQNPGYLDLVNECMEMGCTPIFEYVGNDNPIIVKYGKPTLLLLKVRDMRTGRYCDDLKLALGSAHGVEMPNNYDRSFMVTGFEEHFLNEDNAEGLVITMRNGDMLKWKNSWYLRVASMLKRLNERNIAGMVVTQRIDDAMPHILNTNINMVEFDAVVAKTWETYREFQAQIHHWADLLRDRDIKEAVDICPRELRAPVMRTIRNQPVDIPHFYIQLRLETVFPANKKLHSFV